MAAWKRAEAEFGWVFLRLCQAPALSWSVLAAHSSWPDAASAASYCAFRAKDQQEEGQIDEHALDLRASVRDRRGGKCFPIDTPGIG